MKNQMMKIIHTIILIKLIITQNCNDNTTVDLCNKSGLCRWQNIGRFQCVDFACNTRTTCRCTYPCLWDSVESSCFESCETKLLDKCPDSCWKIDNKCKDPCPGEDSLECSRFSHCYWSATDNKCVLDCKWRTQDNCTTTVGCIEWRNNGCGKKKCDPYGTDQTSCTSDFCVFKNSLCYPS